MSSSLISISQIFKLILPLEQSQILVKLTFFHKNRNNDQAFKFFVVFDEILYCHPNQYFFVLPIYHNKKKRNIGNTKLRFEPQNFNKVFSVFEAQHVFKQH